jgi:hypothetical protein
MVWKHTDHQLPLIRQGMRLIFLLSGVILFSACALAVQRTGSETILGNHGHGCDAACERGNAVAIQPANRNTSSGDPKPQSWLRRNRVPL